MSGSGGVVDESFPVPVPVALDDPAPPPPPEPGGISPFAVPSLSLAPGPGAAVVVVAWGWPVVRWMRVVVTMSTDNRRMVYRSMQCGSVYCSYFTVSLNRIWHQSLHRTYFTKQLFK